MPFVVLSVQCRVMQNPIVVIRAASGSITRVRALGLAFVRIEIEVPPPNGSPFVVPLPVIGSSPRVDWRRWMIIDFK
ncbi:hypothetical protein EVAR_12555_1 [Eumeta japonica]|uniref:Uncharacterized protein n=1 Tax=Eumeta variegata TaxID=151549 RepID=A0A4C1TPU3_EUMVA|nr:hypothetical protein EVAR_12555_1 [Eumeta japonica]